jgi:2-hydroxychromene-2-carboxylate isomerase
MLEPDKNPNPSFMVDPPALMRRVMRHLLGRVIDSAQIQKKRDQAEAKRKAAGAPHVVEYFHQLDDPYAHLTAQILERFAARYDIVVETRLIRAAGGSAQPELEKLAVWARRDAELIAPHYGLGFPAEAPTVPNLDMQQHAARLLAGLSSSEFIGNIQMISTALWSAKEGAIAQINGEEVSDAEADDAFVKGSARMNELNHYSGATFYYAGEWYWGVDRLFHLEQRLRDLGAGKEPNAPYLAPRPDIDVSGIDASQMTLDFYSSLNSPYTSIIFDRTIALKNECGIKFNHKPVLPMIMRGVPAPRAKGQYILFDTGREARFLNVPFGPFWTPIGTPVRRAYSLLPWAMELGKDEALMSSLLKCAFSGNTPLHQARGMRKAVQMAGLDWNEAKNRMGDETWKPMVEGFQDEVVDGLGLWGVPSYKLSGPDGELDLAVWGQDRLWLVAAEIQRRAAAAS